MTTILVEQIPYLNDSCDYFEKLRSLPAPVMFNSSLPCSEKGRFDIITADPDFTLVFNNGCLKKVSENHTETLDKPLLASLKQIQAKHLIKDIPEDLPFCGGFAGYLSYDLGREFENIPVIADNDIELPELNLGFYSWSLVVDHQQQTTSLCMLPDLCDRKKQQIRTLLNRKSTKSELEKFKLINKLKSIFNVNSYIDCFSRIKNYLLAGDCYQVNFAQRFSADYEGDPWSAWKSLHYSMPAPFSAYLEWQHDDMKQPSAILSFSPERFIELKGNRALTQPIKGTTPRGETPAVDQANADSLLVSEKNRAENLMIVDLLRNDLGRCCETGTVKTEKLFELQSFSNVHHLVSSISGVLKPNLTAFDLLAQTLPGGSITGAPKIRAMEIIEELEPFRRSIYCGVITWINVNGDMDSNIAIRTALCHQGKVHCWGGGGIVSDSLWENEYQESLDKIDTILKVLSSNII